MVHETRSAAEKKKELDIQYSNTDDLLLFVKPTEKKARPITVARQLVLSAMCERSVIVSTRVYELVDIIPHEYFAKIMPV